MAQFEKHFVQDLTQDIKIRQCGTIVFKGDNLSNVITVDLYNGTEPYSGGGSVSCSVICPDGATVPITNGSISGNTVSVTLKGDCFALPGQIGVGVQVVSGDIRTTILKAIYNVELLETDTIVDPGSRITASVGQLVSDIENAVAQIPASDMASLMAGIAPTFSASTNYTAGAYVYYNGTLYRFTTAHAAGSWTGTDATAVALGNDLGGQISDLKSAVNVLGDGYSALSASNIVQGSYDVYGNATTNSKRIRNSGMLDIKAGDTLSFTPGNTIKYIFYGIFNTAGAFVSDNGWFPSVNKTFAEDCKLICVFKTDPDANITPSDYDATTKIVPKVPQNVKSYVDEASEKVDSMYSVRNYFDKDTIEYADSTMQGNGTIEADSTADVYYVDLGEIKSSVYMTGALEFMTFRYYNASGNAISSVQFYVDKGPREMSLPSGTRFIRFGCKKTYQPYFMITDAAQYEYIPHYLLNTVVLNSPQNWWAGKIGDSLGDSLTEQRFFQLYTKKYFGLSKFYIHGIGGTKMTGAANQYGDSMWMDSRINALSTDADFVTVLGGQNDGNVEIGEISKSNINTDTYAGALNTVINKIYAHCKSGIIIILCTPFYVPSEGAGGERFARLDEAVRGIAKLHGLPVADFGGLSTADENTADLYWGTDRTHPIEDFHKNKLAPILIGTMENIRPIDWDKINNYGRFINGIQYLP